MFHLTIYKFEEYEELFNHLALFASIILAYYIFSSEENVSVYLFDAANTLILLIGLLLYHLVFIKMLIVKFKK